MEWFLSLPVLGALLVLAIVLKISKKILKKLLLNGMAGLLFLKLLSLFVPGIPIEPWTILVAGFFGLPGLVFLLFFFYTS